MTAVPPEPSKAITSKRPNRSPGINVGCFAVSAPERSSSTARWSTASRSPIAYRSRTGRIHRADAMPSKWTAGYAHLPGMSGHRPGEPGSSRLLPHGHRPGVSAGNGLPSRHTLLCSTRDHSRIIWNVSRCASQPTSWSFPIHSCIWPLAPTPLSTRSKLELIASESSAPSWKSNRK